MQFLVARKNSKLARLDGEIKTLKDSLLPYKDKEEYKDRTNHLLKTLDKEEREQKIKKRKKYNRDYEDYQMNSVFDCEKNRPLNNWPVWILKWMRSRKVRTLQLEPQWSYSIYQLVVNLRKLLRNPKIIINLGKRVDAYPINHHRGH